MASQALSAQGTRIGISTALSGTSLTITAISKAANAVVTTTGATLVKGDVVNISGVTGMTEINGNWLVKAATATSITLEVDSTNFTTYGSGGTMKSYTFVNTCEATSFDGLDGEASEIDTTTLCSVAKEKRLGLQDFGSFSIDYNWVMSDLAQIELRKAQADGKERQIKVILADGSIVYFAGFVKSATMSGGVDAVYTGSSIS